MSQSTTKAQKCIPTGAVGVGVQNAAVSLANSAYVELTPSAAADWIATGLFMSNSSSTSPNGVTFEIDLAVGGTGAEVVIATLRGSRSSGGSQTPMNRFPIPIDAIPAGSRVAVRLRYQNSTNTPGLHQITLFYLDK